MWCVLGSTFIPTKSTNKSILSSPLQNDLKEFHSLIDLCNPGILGKFYSANLRCNLVPRAPLLPVLSHSQV